MGADKIIAEIGLDASAIATSLDSIVAKMNKAATASTGLNAGISKAGALSSITAGGLTHAAAATESVGKSAKNSSWRLSQLSMQMQDVAVQAQMGTSYLTIFAQQGSQVASIFGGMKGAMIGAGLAIAASIGSAIVGSQKNFTALNREAETFSKNLDSITASGGISEITSGLDSAKKQFEDLNVKIEETSEYLSSVAAEVAGLFGGDDTGERLQKLAAAQMKLADSKLKSEIEIARLAGIEQTAIAARNAGDEHGAQIIEEKIRLEKELFGIRNKAANGTITGATADKLEGVAKGKSGVKVGEINKAESDKQEKKQKEIQDKEKKRGEEVLAANQKMQDSEDKLLDFETKKLSLKEQMKVQGGKVHDAEERVKTAAKGTVEWYERMAELARERLSLENLIAQRTEAYTKGTAAGRRFDREQKKKQKENEKGEKRMEEQDERERKKEEEKQKNAPKGAPKLGPEKPKPNGQPAPKPAPEPKGNKGPTMMVETLNVKLLQHA